MGLGVRECLDITGCGGDEILAVIRLELINGGIISQARSQNWKNSIIRSTSLKLSSKFFFSY